MKIRMVVPIIIIAFVTGITGCEPEPIQIRVTTSLELWDSWIKLQEERGREVLSVKKSAQGIQLEILDMRRKHHMEEIKQRVLIPMPVTLDIPGQIYTAVVLDHNSKWRRIIKKNSY